MVVRPSTASVACVAHTSGSTSIGPSSPCFRRNLRCQKCRPHDLEEQIQPLTQLSGASGTLLSEETQLESILRTHICFLYVVKMNIARWRHTGQTMNTLMSNGKICIAIGDSGRVPNETRKYTHWVLSTLTSSRSPYTSLSTFSFSPVASRSKPRKGVKRGINMATRRWYAAYASGYLPREMDSVNIVEE